MKPQSLPPRIASAGFTLVELIIVITLSGIVAVMVSGIVGNQMFGYVETQQRAQLVQMADVALQKIAQDVRNAVPNSVRVSGNFIEMVPVVMAAPYRNAPSGTAGSDALDFSAPDLSFQVLDNLVGSNATLSDAQIVIYNVGLTNGGAPVLGANLYADNPGGANPHVISGTGVTLVNSGDEDQVVLTAAHQFSQRSPEQKMYLVRGALTYHCDPVSGSLRRYQGYPIQSAQPVNAGASPLVGASSALLANSVSGCVFRYSSGTLTRSGVVSLLLTLNDGNQTSTLMKQVQISNVP